MSTFPANKRGSPGAVLGVPGGGSTFQQKRGSPDGVPGAWLPLLEDREAPGASRARCGGRGSGGNWRTDALRSFRPVLRSRVECHAWCGFDNPHKPGTWRRGAARAPPFPRRLRAEQWQRSGRLRTCSLTRGFASRLRNQAGCRGAPASEATITKWPPSSRYRTGTVRSRRDLRPVVEAEGSAQRPSFPSSARRLRGTATHSMQ